MNKRGHILEIKNFALFDEGQRPKDERSVLDQPVSPVSPKLSGK